MVENPYEGPREKPIEGRRSGVGSKVFITLYFLLIGAVVVGLAWLALNSVGF